jgi:hypothetical protein
MWRQQADLQEACRAVGLDLSDTDIVILPLYEYDSEGRSPDFVPQVMSVRDLRE